MTTDSDMAKIGGLFGLVVGTIALFTGAPLWALPAIVILFVVVAVLTP